MQTTPSLGMIGGSLLFIANLFRICRIVFFGFCLSLIHRLELAAFRLFMGVTPSFTDKAFSLFLAFDFMAPLAVMD